MVGESLLTELGIDVVRKALRAIKSKVSDRKYKQLLAEAIAELLKERPDIDEAEAKILAAKAAGIPPSASFLRAEFMLKNVKLYEGIKSKRKMSMKKAPKKHGKMAPKKITKRHRTYVIRARKSHYTYKR